jgi:prepilin-type N-terminal cleavage/methylation domain-containing protein
LIAERNESGVTLIELLIALVIISIVIYALINFFSLNLFQNSRELRRAKLYYQAVAKMEELISKDYASRDLESFYSPLNSSKFSEEANYLYKIQIESINPLTNLVTDPYPIKASEDPLLKKITVTVANLDDYDEKREAMQVTVVRFISPS